MSESWHITGKKNALGTYTVFFGHGEGPHNQVCETPSLKDAQLISAVHELKEACKDILDAFWDMSPLEYAGSRGLSHMSDAEGERIKERARAAIAKAEGRGEKS